MGRLINIGSSSSGNCFIIEDSQCKVVLDLGFKFDKMQKRYRQQTGHYIGGLCIDFCLVTHRHKDHSKGVESFIENLADVYAPETMIEENKKIKAAVPGKTVEAMTQDCSFIPFEVCHYDLIKNMKKGDLREFDDDLVRVPTLGYVLAFHKTGNTWLYLTDTKIVFPPLDSINYAVIECNHDLELIPDDCELHIKRSLSSHLSVQDVCEILKNSNTKSLRKLYLSHNSQTGLNVRKAYKMIKKHFKGEILFCKKDGGFYEI